MKQHLIRFGKFIRIIDVHDGQVSLTNLALLIVLSKLAIAPSLSITEIGGLFIQLLSYQGKKMINNKSSENSEEIKSKINEQITELKDVVSALSIKVGMKR